MVSMLGRACIPRACQSKGYRSVFHGPDMAPQGKRCPHVKRTLPTTVYRHATPQGGAQVGQTAEAGIYPGKGGCSDRARGPTHTPENQLSTAPATSNHYWTVLMPGKTFLTPVFPAHHHCSPGCNGSPGTSWAEEKNCAYHRSF